MIQHPDWDWTVLSLCRAHDPDRSRKFRLICDTLDVSGMISDLDDGNPLAPINPKRDIGWRIRTHLGMSAWDLCITHGANGEYGHERHRQVHGEVLRRFQEGSLRCKELWTFAYVCNPHSGACLARHDADVTVPLTSQQLDEKKRIIHELYGYPEDSFEVRACVAPEAFRRFARE